MPSLHPIAWLVILGAIGVVVVRILAKRIESTGRHVEENERMPHSLESVDLEERSRRARSLRPGGNPSKPPTKPPPAS